MTNMADYRNLTRNILRVYRSATPEQLEEGMGWYDLAFTICEREAAYSGYSIAQMAVALAHLSPRITWRQNVDFLHQLAQGRGKPNSCLGRSWGAAAASLEVADPLTTFSRVALKTGNFARAILGDASAVVVDVWAARAAGVGESMIRSSGGYHAVAEAYRRGGRRAGIKPRDLQACTWVAVRGAAT